MIIADNKLHFSFIICMVVLEYICFLDVIIYGTNVIGTPLSRRPLPNPNALLAVSKGMWSLGLCSNKIFHFLSSDANQHRWTCIVAVKWLLFTSAVMFHSGDDRCI